MNSRLPHVSIIAFLLLVFNVVFSPTIEHYENQMFHHILYLNDAPSIWGFHMHAGLLWVLSQFALVCPISVLALYFCLSMALAFVVSYWLLLPKQEREVQWSLIFLIKIGVLSFLYLSAAQYMSYINISIFLFSVGAVGCVRGIYENRKIMAIVSLVLFALGLLTRFDSAPLAIPVIFIAGVIAHRENVLARQWRNLLNRRVAIIASLVFLPVMVSASQAIVYKAVSIKQVYDYQVDRMATLDYSDSSGIDKSEALSKLGISANDASMAWDIQADADFMTPERVHSWREIHESGNPSKFSLANLKHAMGKLFQFSLIKSVIEYIVFPFLIICLLIAPKRTKADLFAPLIAFAVMLALVIYLVFSGRPNETALVSVFMSGVLCVLLSSSAEVGFSIRPPWGMCIALCLFVVLAIPKLRINRFWSPSPPPAYAIEAKQNPSLIWYLWIDYSLKEDPFSPKHYLAYTPEWSKMNAIPAFFWIAKFPAYQEKLTSLGITNLFKQLDDPRIRIVVHDKSAPKFEKWVNNKLSIYMKEHYAKDIKLQKVKAYDDEISACAITITTHLRI